MLLKKNAKFFIRKKWRKQNLLISEILSISYIQQVLKTMESTIKRTNLFSVLSKASLVEHCYSTLFQSHPLGLSLGPLLIVLLLSCLAAKQALCIVKSDLTECWNGSCLYREESCELRRNFFKLTFLFQVEMFQFMLKSFLLELRCSIQVKSQVFFHVWTFILCREFSDADIFLFKRIFFHLKSRFLFS